MAIFLILYRKYTIKEIKPANLFFKTRCSSFFEQIVQNPRSGFEPLISPEKFFCEPH